MLLEKTPVFDLRNDAWLGTQNGIEFLMPKPNGDGYLGITNGCRAGFKASRRVASHLKEMPEASQIVGDTFPELVKQYAVAVAFDKAAVKRNVDVYKALPDDAPFVVLDMLEWLTSNGSSDAANCVYKHASASIKKPKPYALTHRDTAENNRRHTEYMSPVSHICLMSQEQFDTLQQSVSAAAAQSEMTLGEYFTAAGMLLYTLLRVWQTMPDATIEMFDYVSNKMAVSTPKVRVSMSVNSLDLVDLDVTVGGQSQSFTNLNVYPEKITLSEGMFSRNSVGVNDVMLSVYDGLAKQKMSGKKKAA